MLACTSIRELIACTDSSLSRSLPTHAELNDVLQKIQENYGRIEENAKGYKAGLLASREKSQRTKAARVWLEPVEDWMFRWPIIDPAQSTVEDPRSSPVPEPATGLTMADLFAAGAEPQPSSEPPIEDLPEDLPEDQHGDQSESQAEYQVARDIETKARSDTRTIGTSFKRLPPVIVAYLQQALSPMYTAWAHYFREVCSENGKLLAEIDPDFRKDNEPAEARNKLGNLSELQHQAFQKAFGDFVVVPGIGDTLTTASAPPDLSNQQLGKLKSFQRRYSDQVKKIYTAWGEVFNKADLARCVQGSPVN